MTRQSLACQILSALIAVGICAIARQAIAADKLPNFVVILADDLGYGDVGFQGGVAATPHIDRLAATGVRLSQHYVYPMCSPTRAALLSGRYPSRYGCTAATNKQVFPFGTVTLASALHELGYSTGLVGKWHLGSLPKSRPNEFGFDMSYGSLAGSVGPYDHRYKIGPFTRTWHRDGELIDEEGHVTDLISRAAVQFIEQNRSRPFFLYVPFTAVHLPVDEEKRWKEPNRAVKEKGANLHAACITHMDAAIGDIVHAIEKAQLAENTMIVFLSDNGAHRRIQNNQSSFPGKYPAVKIGGSNAPFSGFKTQLLEGGIRTPAIVNWQGRLSPGTIDTPLHVTDWMPTLCRLAGYTSPRSLNWDGTDIWSVLADRATPPERTMYWLGVGGKSRAARRGDWKLILQDGEKPELYNIISDEAERNNVATTESGKVKMLEKEIARLSAADNDAVVSE